MIDDVTVIIRTVGERTEGVCRDLLSEQVPATHVVSVSNTPFSATLADGYRIGIERGLPWTLCIDADVLVVQDAVRKLRDAAELLPPDAFEVQGLVFDQFLGILRPAGNHLYRTALFDKALPMIPADGQHARPETCTLQQMVQAGHSWHQRSLVVGVHDFQQYYRDVFRTCFVHAGKHAELLSPLITYWRDMAQAHDDYKVALAGAAAGIAAIGAVQLDASRDHGFEAWSEQAGIPEHAALGHGQVKPQDIGQILEDWVKPQSQQLLGFERACLIDTEHTAAGIVSPTRREDGRVGFPGVIPWFVGKAMCKVGRRIERLAGR